MRALLTSNGKALNVIDPVKQKKRGDKYLHSGTLHATYCYIEENPTFSDVSLQLYFWVYFLAELNTAD